MALWVLALIGIAVYGLINGTVNTMTKMPEESAWGAFAGGFFEGVVSAATSAVGLVMTAYIASLPKSNINEFRDEERIKSQRER